MESDRVPDFIKADYSEIELRIIADFLNNSPASFRLATDIIHNFTAHWLAKHKGMIVKMPRGRYAGRDAVVDHAHYDPGSRELLVLLYTLRADGSGDYLNNDAQTRMYWKLSEIKELTL